MAKKQQPKKTLVELIAGLEEQESLDTVVERLRAGEDPFELLGECQEGMQVVGQRYEQGRYYISALIMAGEILREAIELLQPHLTGRITGGGKGRIVIGTVQGDIHDIGKNLLRDLLECHEFTVTDLGIDVTPERFISYVREHEVDIVALSGLLTSSFDAMKETTRRIHEEARQADRKPPVIVIGGGMIDMQVCRFIGADSWATDAMMGVEICRELMGDTD